LPFIESVTTERSKHNEHIPRHLQESSAVNVKGATLKGKVPARCRDVLLPTKLFLMAKMMSNVHVSAVPDKKKEHKSLTSCT